MRNSFLTATTSRSLQDNVSDVTRGMQRPNVCLAFRFYMCEKQRSFKAAIYFLAPRCLSITEFIFVQLSYFTTLSVAGIV